MTARLPSAALAATMRLSQSSSCSGLKRSKAMAAARIAFSFPVEGLKHYHSMTKNPALNSVCPQVCRSGGVVRSEEHTSELQSQSNLVCRLLLEKKKKC